MKKINRSIRSLFLAVVVVGLAVQPMQMIGQEMPLRQRASQSFNDFYRYFKERFPNVSAAPSQVKAMLEVGKRKWRGEPVSPELRQAAWKGLI